MSAGANLTHIFHR